jgi:hypothetical protein
VNRLGRAPEPSAVHSHPPSVPHVSSIVRVASLATVDLQAKLEHRRSGKDDRAAIERQQEGRRCQGHNLDGDFDDVDTTPVGQAASTTTPPAGSRDGCMALVLHLRMVVWPRKFWPLLLEKYNGSVTPIEFLQIYSTLILTAGGDEAIMANYFLVALTGTARSWLMNLPEGPSRRERSCAISSRPTSRVPMLARAMRSTSTSCNNA